MSFKPVKLGLGSCMPGKRFIPLFTLPAELAPVAVLARVILPKRAEIPPRELPMPPMPPSRDGLESFMGLFSPFIPDMYFMVFISEEDIPGSPAAIPPANLPTIEDLSPTLPPLKPGRPANDKFGFRGLAPNAPPPTMLLPRADGLDTPEFMRLAYNCFRI